MMSCNNAAGGGSEAGNAKVITGKIIDENGSGASGANVFIKRVNKLAGLDNTSHYDFNGDTAVISESLYKLNIAPIIFNNNFLTYSNFYNLQ